MEEENGSLRTLLLDHIVSEDSVLAYNSDIFDIERFCRDNIETHLISSIIKTYTAHNNLRNRRLADSKVPFMGASYVVYAMRYLTDALLDELIRKQNLTAKLRFGAKLQHLEQELYQRTKEDSLPCVSHLERLLELKARISQFRNDIGYPLQESIHSCPSPGEWDRLHNQAWGVVDKLAQPIMAQLRPCGFHPTFNSIMADLMWEFSLEVLFLQLAAADYLSSKQRFLAEATVMIDRLFIDSHEKVSFMINCSESKIIHDNHSQQIYLLSLLSHALYEMILILLPSMRRDGTAVQRKCIARANACRKLDPGWGSAAAMFTASSRRPNPEQ